MMKLTAVWLYLRNVLTKMMLNYKISQLDFYIEYMNARIIGGWDKTEEEGEKTEG